VAGRRAQDRRAGGGRQGAARGDHRHRHLHGRQPGRQRLGGPQAGRAQSGGGARAIPRGRTGGDSTGRAALWPASFRKGKVPGRDWSAIIGRFIAATRAQRASAFLGRSRADFRPLTRRRPRDLRPLVPHCPPRIRPRTRAIAWDAPPSRRCAVRACACAADITQERVPWGGRDLRPRSRQAQGALEWRL
jgi:hypothetical protein